MNRQKLLAITTVTSVATTLSLTLNPLATQAFTISTNFDPPDISLGSTTFTVGTPQASATFDGGTTVFEMIPEFYHTPPAAYLLEGAGAGGAGTVGTIAFSNPVNSVSFFAINAGNGQATIDLFDSLSNPLTSATVTASLMSDPDAGFNFNFSDISSIIITNPGPASPPNPPYRTFIDSFSASAAKVPEPGSILGLAIFSGLGLASLRKRQRGKH